MNRSNSLSWKDSSVIILNEFGFSYVFSLVWGPREVLHILGTYPKTKLDSNMSTKMWPKMSQSFWSRIGLESETMPSRKVKANEGLMRRSSRTPRQMENTEDLPQSSRKRKIYPSPSSEDRSRKQIKKTIDGRNMDSYCWICHELGQDELCSICCRVFHSSCLSKKLNFNNQKCPECQKNTIVGNEVCFTVSQDKLQRLLSYAVTQVYKSVNVPSCLWRWPSTEENDKLGQIIDGEILIDKLNGDKNHYKTVAAFYSDVKFLLHNSHILYGGNSNEVQGAKRLLKSFKTELMDIEACPECYENKISEVRFLPDFFSRICKDPHTIIWAKLKGFPYWPAKSLRIVEDAADVRFFGTHDKAFVPVNNCFLMSREYPTPKTPKQNKFLDAMKELNAYISRFNKEVGTFQFAAAKMAYETENLDCDHSETVEMDERDNSFTITGNDVVDDNTLLLTASENDLSEEFLDSSEGENTLSGGLLDVSEETEFPSLEVPAPLTYPTVTDVSSSSYVEKEVHNQTFTPVSVSMTFSTDEEVQRSYESSYQSNAASLSVPATTDSIKSATAQNERNGNQNISVLASSDVAVLASPVVTGSQSLAVPASFMEQAFINYMSNDAHNELPHVYGINYNNLSQSQIAQNLQPTRFSLSLGSENDSIQEQGVISGSKTLCDNTFVNTVQAHGNYSNCVVTNSSVDQSVPVNSSQAEFSIAGLCAECDNNHEENALNQVGDESGEEIEFICETRGTVANT
ncbi:protein kinase C-binding protein 1-like, partial [Stegodyphus dumicola]|uniref:protein kinase C-binding protein 1-like n=1 Tax=Stegodyphus dumicola TaxID=202533 RepID=UPI0015A9069D